MEFVPVPKTENQSAQTSEKSIGSTFSPEALILSRQISQQFALQNNSDDEIDLAELWRAIWSGKLTIIVISFIFAVASIAFALSKPDVYKASVLLSPASSDGTGGMGAIAGQFGSLASLAGISLGGGGGDKTTLALEIIKSRSFIEDFIHQHELLVPLMAAKEWDVNKDELIYDNDIYDMDTKIWIREVKFPQTVKPSPWESFEAFSKLLSISQDKGTSMVTIKLSFFSPYIAKQWLVWLVEDLNNFIREQDQQNSRDSIDYLIKQLEKTKIANMETVFYQLIEDQTKNMMLTQINKEYVLKTVDPAQVPDKKDSPNRAIIIVLGLMLGGMFSILVVLFRYHSSKKIINDK